MEKIKKLKNINKSIFIRFFESDFLVWLSNKDNFNSIEQINIFLPDWHKISLNPKGNYDENSSEWEDENSIEDETIFDGNEIGTLSRIYFNNKIQYKNKCKDFDDKIFSQALVKETKESIANKKYLVYFEAGFQYKNFTLRPDILLRNDDGTFDIIEVKASTKVKPTFLLDLFYQYTIMSNLGYRIRNVKLLLINNSYNFKEKNIDLEQMFKIVDRDFNSKFQFPYTKENIEILKKEAKEILGPRTRSMIIYFNDLMVNLKEYFIFDILNSISDLYHKNINDFHDENNIKKILEYFFNLENNSTSEFKLLKMSSNESKAILRYYTYKIFDNDVNDNMELKDSILNFYAMPSKQKMKLIYETNGKPLSRINIEEDIGGPMGLRKENWKIQIEAQNNPSRGIIQYKNLKEQIAKMNIINAKLIFYDFESFKSPIPIFHYTKPYQQICFQYSIHYSENINELNKMNIKSSKNINYIQTKTNNYFDFINQFIKDAYDKYILENNSNYKYVVYHKTFENKRIEEMIEYLEQYNPNDPNLIENIRKLAFIKNNTIDIKEPFQKFNFWLKDFIGSASIKKVLPAIVKNLSYEDLEIKNGSLASFQYKKYFLDIERSLKDETLFENLKLYCRLDTWSMVEITKYILNCLLKIENLLKGEKDNILILEKSKIKLSEKNILVKYKN